MWSRLPRDSKSRLLVVRQLWYKSWDKLKKILGPSVRLDFRSINGVLEESLTPEQFAALISSKKVIGDPRVKTQHLLGGSDWSESDDGTVQVWWQLRVAHQRYEDLEHTSVAFRGHAHGSVTHRFKKIDGSWKLSGVRPEMYWTEHDFDKIFA